MKRKDIFKIIGVILLFFVVYNFGMIVMILGTGVPCFFRCNNPFVIMGIQKTNVLGHEVEELQLKYRLDYTEYNESGDIITQYYIPPEKSSRLYYAWHGAPEERRVKVTYENNIAVDMSVVGVYGDSNEYYVVDEPFDDWFTSYPYLGFIY